MDDLKEAGKAVVDFMGIVVPSISFIMISVIFMISICSRYSFRSAVIRSYEVSALGYMRTMFFGVSKAIEADEHVVFGPVYDTLKPFGQFMCKMVYNVFLLALLLFCFIPRVQALLGRQTVTRVLKLSYTVVFAPSVYILTKVIVRTVIDIVKTVKDYKQIKEGAT